MTLQTLTFRNSHFITHCSQLLESCHLSRLSQTHIPAKLMALGKFYLIGTD
jgi:hypothetical protein